MTDWVAIGVVLLVVGAALGLLAAGVSSEALGALGVGVAVFGAAMILRTIGPRNGIR